MDVGHALERVKAADSLCSGRALAAHFRESIYLDCMVSARLPIIRKRQLQRSLSTSIGDQTQVSGMAIASER